MLMNVLIPLCIRVGSGRKDVAPLRQADISFILTVVLNAMSPPGPKTNPTASQNIKTVSEMRAGSLTGGSHTDSKKQTLPKVPRSLYQVSFLALKILIVCFERELTPDWPRTARVLRDQVRHKDAGAVFWNFLDFVVTQRTPLFVLLLPFISQKLTQPPTSDAERHSMFVIREKLRGFSLPLPKSRSTLLMELAHEIKELKEELDDKRYDEQVMDRHIVMETTHARHHRPSIIDLLTGATHQFDHQRNVHRESVCSVASSNKGLSKEDTPDKGSATAPGEAVSPTSPGDEDSSEVANRPRLQRSKAQSRKTFRLRKSRKNRPDSKGDPQKQLSADSALSLPRQKELGSESELLKLTRHMSVRARRPTETAELTLETETSGLGRVRHHSTLALSHLPPSGAAGAGGGGPGPRQTRLGSIGEQRSPRLAALHLASPPASPPPASAPPLSSCPPLLPPNLPPGLPQGAPLARPYTTPPSLSEPRSDEDSSFSSHLPPPLQPTPALGSGAGSIAVPVGARLGPRGSYGPSDLSYDEDSAMSVTSSTSGYRENCSLLMMAMDSPPDDSTMLRGGGGGSGGGGLMQVGTALGTALSTSSTTVAGDPSSPEHSPEHSSTTTGTADGETTALLGHSHSQSQSHSQHSLLESFDRQDEDTLI
ncbi:protein unc-80 homolog [Frankliniella occidentalis]|uniref:Protein unc-80 homolog n=1 Tax=Frankliniella occidentalis TaxID=133901 RepID=A0A9C6XWD3_FRAOC|nr:protein unc-80 homolog [Frankliniella occidentalis]